MNFQNNTIENISNPSINILNDEILFQFYYKCKTNILDLETWITENKLIINSAVSIDSSKFSAYTPLHFAVRCCNYNAVCILLKCNANCNIKNANNQTPIHLAMEMILVKRSFKSNKKLQIILDEMLLALKTNCMNSVNNMGLSHFHIACYRNGKGTTCITKYGLIINNFINMDSPYWPGYTPLHITCTYLFLNLARSLLEHGANINAKNAIGWTPFHIAIKKRNKLLINDFYSRLNGNCTSLLKNRGFSILHLECMWIDKCDSNFLWTISQHTGNINIPVTSDSPLWAGCTPLHIAVHKKCMYMIRILIQFGADINAKDLNEISPLQHAIHKGLINNGFIDLILSEYNKTKIKLIDDYELFKLFSACMSTESVEIQHLLKRGVNVNSTIPLCYPFDLPGYTPLHLAVESGKIDIVELLLENGADIYVQDMNKLSPLHLAAQRAKYCIMEKILSFHAEVMNNPIDNKGLSHLHIACMVGKADIVEKFLQYGVEVNLVTRTGETPLHYAVKSGSEKTVELLLKHNADFTIQEIQGSTPLHIAVWSKKEKIVNMMLSVSNHKILNPVDMTELSHFHIACMKDKPTLVKKFLFNGRGSSTQIKPDSKNYAGFTPLHFAVKHNCSNIVKILLNHDSDFTTKDALNKFPMHYAFKLSPNDSKKMLDLFWSTIEAKTLKLVNETELFSLYIICITNKYTVMKKLLKQGTAIDICTSTEYPLWPDYSTLHLAVKFGSIKTVKLLLSHDSCVNVVDKYGFTPLHLACSCSKKEIVVELLKKGCNSAAKSVKGLTPLRLALQANNEEIARIILLQPTAMIINPMDNKGLTYFHIACLKNLISIIQNFLLMAVDVNGKVHPLASKYPGYTPLHIAIERRNLQLIDLLLTHGVNVNAVNSHGCTPLHLTCTARASGSCVIAASKLLKFGANPNIRNGQGDAIVELAVMYHKHKILEVALRHGADLNLKNSEIKGCRPLELAIISRQL